jgi:hypothetical protein
MGPGKMTLRMDAVRKGWLLGGWIGIALVVYLSLTPSPPEVDLGAYTDKWEHMTAYAVLMWWFCQLHTAARSRLQLAAWLLALGIALEFGQRMTGLRSFEVADMIAGGMGVALGWLLAPPRTPEVLSRLARADEERGAR